MSCSIARKVVTAFRRPTMAALAEPLAPREEELLILLARGRSYKECASEMNCSDKTIGTYIRRLYKKLQVHSRHEAVLKLRECKMPGH